MGNVQATAVSQSTSVQVERLLNGAGYVRFSVIYALRTCAFLVFVVYWGHGWRSDPSQAAIGILAAIAFLGSQMRWSSLPFMARPLPMKETPRLRVAVVTTCVPSVEPLSMIERTLAAFIELDYPHDTWLLDEEDQPELRELCERLGVRHASRKPKPWYWHEAGIYAAYTKHGNYNAWLDEIGYENYDILVAFDADHVPEPQFTSATLSYFADASVGYVQAPQAYHNQSAGMIARGAAEETYGYYSAGQMASFGLGRVVVTGSHCAHRLSALRQVGGFPDHLAEDLVLTTRYRAAGWRGVYIPQVLATGQAPETWPAYIRQQLRWTQSLLDIKLRRLPGFRELGFSKSLLDYLQGFGYLYDAMLAAGALLIVGMTLATGYGQRAIERFDSLPVAFIFAFLAASEAYRWRFYFKPAQARGPHWRAAILRLAKWPYTLWDLWVVLRRAPTRYVVTPKTAVFTGERLLLAPHLAVLLFLGLCLVVGIAAHRQPGVGAYVWGGFFALFSIALVGFDLWPRSAATRGSSV
jgi:cellulose synthase (UDP-forming)